MHTNPFRREHRPRQKGWNATQLIKALMCIAGIYLGWFFFVLQNLGNVHDETTMNSPQGQKEARLNHFTKGDSGVSARNSVKEMKPDAKISNAKQQPPMTGVTIYHDSINANVIDQTDPIDVADAPEEGAHDGDIELP